MLSGMMSSRFHTSLTLLERLRFPSEQEAWRRFARLYTPLLFHWTRRMGLSSDDAADLVQDVFVTLVEKLPEFRYDAGQTFRGWLRTVLQNKWRDRLRRQAVRMPVAADGNRAVLAEIEDSRADSLFTEAEYRDWLVGRALELMKSEFQPQTWQACWEFVVAERPAAEVARELGLTENAVYLAKARVLRRLKQELAGLVEF